MNIWKVKSAFLLSRGVLASFGFIKTIYVLSVISVSDYSQIALVESISGLVCTVFGFISTDSLLRESATNKNSTSNISLIITSHINCFIISIFVGISFFLVSLFYSNQNNDLSNLLFLAFLITHLEKMWVFTLASYRVFDRNKEFLIYSTLYGFVSFIFTCLLVKKFLLIGYFYAQIASLLLVLLFLGVKELGNIIKSFKYSFAGHWLRDTKQLWGVSFFYYIYKLSNTAWRRLPIILAAFFVSQEQLGAATAALAITYKIHIIQQSLTPLLMPKITKDYINSYDSFRESAVNELIQIFSIYVVVIFVVSFFWDNLSRIAFDGEKLYLINEYILLALFVEVVFLIPNIVNSYILVPSSNLTKVLVPTIVVRCMVVPVFFILIFGFEYEGDYALLVSMFVTGFMLVIIYVYETFKLLLYNTSEKK